MIKISAVTIAKNEAKNIGRWIDSARHYADEIIVVDTGSDDDTCAIAAAAGARVEHFAWIDDFAAAKNYALDLACGQWIAFLDADEYFPPEVADRVRETIERVARNRKNFGILTPLVNIDTDNYNRPTSTINQIRIFRSHPAIRFVGSIHECLDGLHQTGRRIVVERSLTILHTGYSASMTKRKCRRDLELLERRIAENGEQFGDSAYLAGCYLGLKEYDKAIEAAKKQISSGKKRVLTATTPWYCLIAARCHLNQPLEVIMPDIEAAIKEFPNIGLFYFLGGTVYFREGDYLKAAEYYQRGLEIIAVEYDDNDIVSHVTARDRGESVMPLACQHLSSIAFLKGDKNSALDYIRKSLGQLPYERKALGNLLSILADGGLDDAEAELRRIYPSGSASDAAFIAEAIADFVPHRTGFFPALYDRYAKRSGISFNTASSRLAVGNVAAAVEYGINDYFHCLASGIIGDIGRRPMPESPIAVLSPTAFCAAWQIYEQGAGALPGNQPVAMALEMIAAAAKAGKKAADEDGSEAVAAIVNSMQNLFLAVFELIADNDIAAADKEALLCRVAESLPAGLSRLVAFACQGNAGLAPTDVTDFYSFFPGFAASASDGALAQIAETAWRISETSAYELANSCVKMRRWSQAYDIYSRINAKSPLVTGDFWGNFGSVLYQLNDYESAEAALIAAQESGSRMPQIAAYLKWIGEKI